MPTDTSREITRVTRQPGSSIWPPIEEFAAAQGVPVEEVRTEITSGALNGALLGSRWYVICSMVELNIPDPTRPHRAVLRLHAVSEDDGFAAGFGRHELRLKYAREEVRTAIAKLTAPMAQDSATPIDINLAGRTIRLYCSLHGEVLSALFEWQIEVEHRDRLKQYQPELDSRET